ncbi:ribbon-helix-helix protein [Nitratireductor rhodophyticola]|uniref:ribbon-helix-helix protein n=1 Tax=Nitratireductor rhodophyticola TaxID=2854036 RepID=UPI003BAA41B4
MTTPRSKHGFASRPADPERWVRTSERSRARASGTDGYTARLTIDITPDLRGRIKIVAFERGQTVADMLRALLAREFPEPPGDES